VRQKHGITQAEQLNLFARDVCNELDRRIKDTNKPTYTFWVAFQTPPLISPVDLVEVIKSWRKDVLDWKGSRFGMQAYIMVGNHEPDQLMWENWRKATRNIPTDSVGENS